MKASKARKLTESARDPESLKEALRQIKRHAKSGFSQCIFRWDQNAFTRVKAWVPKLKKLGYSIWLGTTDLGNKTSFTIDLEVSWSE